MVYISHFEENEHIIRTRKEFPSVRHNFLNPFLKNLGTKARVRFSGSCLKQDKSRKNSKHLHCL